MEIYLTKERFNLIVSRSRIDLSYQDIILEFLKDAILASGKRNKNKIFKQLYPILLASPVYQNWLYEFRGKPRF